MVRVKMTLLFISMMIASACGQPPIYSVDKRVEPLVKEFIKESDGKVSSIDDLQLSFGNTHLDKFKDKDVVGYCDWPDGHPRVVLDETWYFKQNDLSKKALVYHELGHCILDQDHRNGKLADGCNKSLMNEYVSTSDCFQKHYDSLIKELFNPEVENAQSKARTRQPFRKHYSKDSN